MKKSKSFIILTCSFGLLGVALFLFAGNLAGWDILGWFGTGEALLVYFLIALCGMSLLLWWVKNRK